MRECTYRLLRRTVWSPWEARSCTKWRGACCVYCDDTCSKIVSHVVLTIMIPMIISCCGFLFRSYNVIFSNTITYNYLYFSVCVCICVCVGFFRHVIDGHKMILLREDDKEQKVRFLHSLSFWLYLLLSPSLFLLFALSLSFSLACLLSLSLSFTLTLHFLLLSLNFVFFHSNTLPTPLPPISPTHLQQVEACTFEQYEVYAIDVAMTSGDGKPKEHASRTTVLKRLVDMKYGLKVRTHSHTHCHF